MIMLGGLVYLGVRLKEEQKVVKTYSKASTPVNIEPIPMAAQIIEQKTDKNGAKHIVVKKPIPITQTVQLGVENKARIEDLIKELDIKEKQLQSVTMVKARLETELLAAKSQLKDNNNPGGGREYVYKDKQVTASFDPSLGAEGAFKFAYDADLNISEYRKRSWLLGPQNDYIDIFSADPRLTIGGVDRVTVAPKKPALGLALRARVKYYPISTGLGLGGGLELRYKRTYLEGSYQYLTSRKEWLPSVGLGYDLISF